MNKYIFDVAFTVESPSDDWNSASAEDLLRGLEKRVAYLRTHPDEVLDACGYVDSIEE